MSITFPLSLPTSPTTRKIQLGQIVTVGESRSPFTGSAQYYTWPGEYWVLNAELPPILNRADAEGWLTTLMALRGKAGTFQWGPPDGKTPRGNATQPGSYLTDTTGNTAGSKELHLTGFANNGTGVLKAGDYVCYRVVSGPTLLRSRLFKSLTDANSDSSGKVTLDIFPALRETISVALDVRIVNPAGTFRLAQNKFSWDLEWFMQYGISFSAVEDF